VTCSELECKVKHALFLTASDRMLSHHILSVCGHLKQAERVARARITKESTRAHPGDADQQAEHVSTCTEVLNANISKFVLGIDERTVESNDTLPPAYVVVVVASVAAKGDPPSAAQKKQPEPEGRGKSFYNGPETKGDHHGHDDVFGFCYVAERREKDCHVKYPHMEDLDHRGYIHLRQLDLDEERRRKEACEETNCGTAISPPRTTQHPTTTQPPPLSRSTGMPRVTLSESP
jgi:hypothetical protein